jgi:hypothetical protein
LPKQTQVKPAGQRAFDIITARGDASGSFGLAVACNRL